MPNQLQFTKPKKEIRSIISSSKCGVVAVAVVAVGVLAVAVGVILFVVFLFV